MDVGRDGQHPGVVVERLSLLGATEQRQRPAPGSDHTHYRSGWSLTSIIPRARCP